MPLVLAMRAESDGEPPRERTQKRRPGFPAHL